MGAGPQFGAAVVRGGVDDGYIDDEVVGGCRLVKVGPELARVDVQRLLVRVGQAGVATVEGILDALAEYGLRHVDDEVVGQHVAEEIRRERRRVLLQVAVFELIGHVVEGQDLIDIGEHALAQDGDVVWVDGAVEDDEAIFADGGDGLLQVFGV